VLRHLVLRHQFEKRLRVDALHRQNAVPANHGDWARGASASRHGRSGADQAFGSFSAKIALESPSGRVGTR
jgi:hypothetical protein